MYTQATNESLTFILEGFEQVLAFRAKIRVSYKDIVHVTWHEKFNQWPNMQIRMPGSYLPSWIMAGSYWNEEGWDFIFARKPKGLLLPMLFDVLVVETSRQKYRRIIIQMNQEKAKEILGWWDESKLL